MNYKEKYENALEGIQEILSSGQDSIKMSRLKLRLQGIFPELAESEDEKIRKGIIRCVKGSMPDNDFRKKYLDWLEKQGEKECVLKSSKDKDVHKFMKYIEKQAKAYEFNLPNRSYDIYAFAKDILTWLEKQKPTISWHKVEPKEYVLEKSLILKENGEIDVVQDTILSVTDAEYVIPFSLLKNLPKSDSQEKNLINDTDEEIVKVVENTSILDMVEPKFKVGDWVVDSQGLTYQIERVVENVTTHTFGYDIVGGGYFNDDNEGAHLWTIQDAKDGDVLATEDKNFTTPFVAIYKSLGDTVKGLRDNLTFNSHCFIGFNGNFYEGEDGHAIEDAHPATKEQCDLLFQKMREAGYEWDTDKKELLDYKLLINESEVLQNEINWLKSLKLQNHWKPSDEQMRSLSNAINVLHDLRENTDYGFLVSLYNDLKTLKEAGYEWDVENKKLKKEEVDNLHNYLYGEQKPTWGEDDISNIDHLLNALCGVTELKQLQIDKLIIWLKSLKGRVQPNQWKPSEEQMEALNVAMDRNDKIGFILGDLYHNLEGLKEK